MACATKIKLSHLLMTEYAEKRQLRFLMATRPSPAKGYTWRRADLLLTLPAAPPSPSYPFLIALAVM